MRASIRTPTISNQWVTCAVLPLLARGYAVTLNSVRQFHNRRFVPPDRPLLKASIRTHLQERFEGHREPKDGKWWGWVPHGSGHHQCPGMDLTTYIMKVRTYVERSAAQWLF